MSEGYANTINTKRKLAVAWTLKVFTHGSYDFGRLMEIVAAGLCLRIDTHWNPEKLQCRFQVSSKCLYGLFCPFEKRMVLPPKSMLPWTRARGSVDSYPSHSRQYPSQILSPRACQSEGANKEALRHEVEELKKKDLALDQEIAQLLAEGYSLEELEKHISWLHEYNDIKDTGQMLLGKLATIRGITTKELYPKFDLELTD